MVRERCDRLCSDGIGGARTHRDHARLDPRAPGAFERAGVWAVTDDDSNARNGMGFTAVVQRVDQGLQVGPPARCENRNVNGHANRAPISPAMKGLVIRS